MDPKQVARVLEEIAAMLELAGENPFKIRAYENGARAILAFSGNLEAAVASRELLKTPGIGTGLFANVETLVRTGSLPFYNELRARFPPGLRECLRIPGLGARKVKQLHDALGIDSLAALESACREGRVAGAPGASRGDTRVSSLDGPRLFGRDRGEPSPEEPDRPRHQHRGRVAGARPPRRGVPERARRRRGRGAGSRSVSR